MNDTQIYTYTVVYGAGVGAFQCEKLQFILMSDEQLDIVFSKC